MVLHPLLLVLGLSLLPTTILAESAYLAVKGTLFCNDQPAAKVEVLLKEYDMFAWDDKLTASVSDEKGDFYIAAYVDENWDIHPYVKFVHSCNAEPGKRQSVSFKVLPEYFNKLYDMTAVNLNIDYEGAWEEDVDA